ncbi:MAG: hypothetical protein K2O78_06130 [Muribaculaceae bacterium]|nr:hypothetical protein [Muribaculaceae bacterium]
MRYVPSVNIELNRLSDINYVVTENARLTAGSIMSGYRSGHHCFSIIGTYGTGKSSFILALEDDMARRGGGIVNPDVLGKEAEVECINIVGEYAPLSRLLTGRLNCHGRDVLQCLKERYEQIHRRGGMLLIVIDEFGKVLEYAAKNEPEREIYFLQQLAEFVNLPSRRMILLTTLHQNFGTYASPLTETQRYDWHKVKGRFREIVFAEPVEQLLALTARRIGPAGDAPAEVEGVRRIYDLGRQSRIVPEGLDYATALRMYPLDAVSAVCLTMAIQRYGQNERTLFSFLADSGTRSVKRFDASPGLTYSLAELYDYIAYNFYSALSAVNSDSMGWRALGVALERAEGADLDDSMTEACRRMIKSIGLVNIFFKGVRLDDAFLDTYGRHALGLTDPAAVLEVLSRRKIIRFARYKGQYILYEGTDINIEDELYKASAVVPEPMLTVEELSRYIRRKVSLAYASYYRTGTPRYFEYRVVNAPVAVAPSGVTDGCIQLVFPSGEMERDVAAVSASENAVACVYGYFRNTAEIRRRLHEIRKLEYLRDTVAIDDHVASSEIERQLQYETASLDGMIGRALTSGADDVRWYFRGDVQPVESVRDFNRMLSRVADEAYARTPVLRNELINRHKVSSAISLARVNLLDAMLRGSHLPDFGIEGFPPERTIYHTLLRQSGMHRPDAGGQWVLGAPQSAGLRPLWDASMEFLESAADKPRPLTELAGTLRSAPYGVKQGVIDFWIPIFIYINQQQLALYNGNTYVLAINREVFELMQKRLAGFTVRTYRVSGIRLEFFRRYRQLLAKDEEVAVSSDSLLETVKPFFRFYRSLNPYARATRKFDSPCTVRFRDVLASAEDPAKAFFDDLPAAFGYRELNGAEFIGRYLDMIRCSIRELTQCYDNLIDRIEERIAGHLGLPDGFDTYIPVLRERYGRISPGVLPPKTRAFLERIKAPSASKREWIEKLAIVVTDRRLYEIKDADEERLIQGMLHIFSQLERYSALPAETELADDDEAFSIELASSAGHYASKQTFRLPRSKADKARQAADRINAILTSEGDEELNICVLLRLLNQRLK